MEKKKRNLFWKVFSAIALIVFLGLIFKNGFFEEKLSGSNPHHTNIVLAALPKSGSTYLLESLHENLGYQHMPSPSDLRKERSVIAFHSCYHTEVLLRDSPKGSEDFFQKKLQVARVHYHAPRVVDDKERGLPLFSVDKLKKNGNKMIIHLRDPRQALVSYVHHLNKNINIENGFSFILPDISWWSYDFSGYCGANFKTQMDWAIENHLPHIVNWINDWVAFKDKEDKSSDGVKIMITTHDELVENESQLFQKIVDFYEIPFDMANFKSIAKNVNVRFRKGERDEWRSVLTEAQKNRIAEIVPAELLTRFNWD